jgi:hypothetical protein
LARAPRFALDPSRDKKLSAGDRRGTTGYTEIGPGTVHRVIVETQPRGIGTRPLATNDVPAKYR